MRIQPRRLAAGILGVIVGLIAALIVTAAGGNPLAANAEDCTYPPCMAPVPEGPDPDDAYIDQLKADNADLRARIVDLDVELSAAVNQLAPVEAALEEALEDLELARYRLEQRDKRIDRLEDRVDDLKALIRLLRATR